MPIRFDPEEIDRMKAILEFDPRGKEVIDSAISNFREIEKLARSVRFPINSFAELAEQVGEQGLIRFGGKEMSLSALKREIPSYYFPMTSEDDFFDKASEVLRQKLPVLKEEEEVGEKISARMAPPEPPELKRVPSPSEIPEGRFVGIRMDEIRGGG
jgi:hypothetical protein